MIKANRFHLIGCALVALAMLSVCYFCAKGPCHTPVGIAPDVDVMTTEWSYEGASVVLPMLYTDGQSLDSVNLAITNMWEEFVSQSQHITSTYQVDFSVWQHDNLVSIAFSGEVWTPTKAIPFAFGFNYDLVAECQLELSQVISLDKVYTALDKENERFRFENLRYNFDHYFLGCATWSEHIHDFYFDDNMLFVVVPLSPAAGGYTVVGVEGDTRDTGTVSVNPK